MVLTVLVHGPQGCGKTHHSETLRRKFGCRQVVEWDGQETVVHGALHLACRKPRDAARRFDMVLTAAQAFKLAGVVARPTAGPMAGQAYPPGSDAP